MFQTSVAVGKCTRAPPAAAGETEGETQAPGESGDRWVARGCWGREPHGPALGARVPGDFGLPWRGVYSERQQLSFFLKWDFFDR